MSQSRSSRETSRATTRSQTSSSRTRSVSRPARSRSRDPSSSEPRFRDLSQHGRRSAASRSPPVNAAHSDSDSSEAASPDSAEDKPSADQAVNTATTRSADPTLPQAAPAAATPTPLPPPSQEAPPWVNALLQHQSSLAADTRDRERRRFREELDRLERAQRESDARHTAELLRRDEILAAELRRRDTEAASLRQQQAQLQAATLDALRRAAPPAAAAAAGAGHAPPASSYCAPSASSSSAAQATSSAARPGTPPSAAARALFDAALLDYSESPLSEFFRRALDPDADADSVIPPHVFPADLPEDQREALAQDALLTGPNAMGIDIPGTLLTALIRHASRVQFIPPPTQQPLNEWLNERRNPRSRTTVATAASLFNPDSITAFNRSWATWQRHTWGRGTYGSRNAVEAGTAFATFINTVHTMDRDMDWVVVRAWILFTLGLWMRTHMLVPVEIPELTPYIRRAAARQRDFAATQPPTRATRRDPSATAGGTPAARASFTDDIPPRGRRYTCNVCNTLGWTHLCCPICHPDRPGAAAWIAEFDAGRHSRTEYSYGFPSVDAMQAHHRRRDAANNAAPASHQDKKPPPPKRG